MRSLSLQVAIEYPGPSALSQGWRWQGCYSRDLGSSVTRGFGQLHSSEQIQYSMYASMENQGNDKELKAAQLGFCMKYCLKIYNKWLYSCISLILFLIPSLCLFSTLFPITAGTIFFKCESGWRSHINSAASHVTLHFHMWNEAQEVKWQVFGGWLLI